MVRNRRYVLKGQRMKNVMNWTPRPLSALQKRYAVASITLVALLLAACGGGGDTPPAPLPPPPPPVAVWQTPQIAPVSYTSVLLVQTDGADGVFVVGATSNDGLVVPAR